VAKTGQAAPAYGTHRTTTTAGYVRIYEPTHPLANSDGYVLEHRKVLYDAGIEVPLGAHVHHKNGNKADNRRQNLAVHEPLEHFRHHRRRAGAQDLGLVPSLIKLPADVHRAWRDRAAAEGRTLGSIVREALVTYLGSA
jgi:hypothetical protein